MSAIRLTHPLPVDSKELLRELENQRHVGIPENRLAAEKKLGYRPKIDKDERVRRDTSRLIAILSEFGVSIYRIEDIKQYRRDRSKIFLNSKRKLQEGLLRQLVLLSVIAAVLFIPNWTVDPGTPLSVFLVSSMVSVFFLIPLAVLRIVTVTLSLVLNKPYWIDTKLSKYREEIPDDVLATILSLAEANKNIRFKIYELTSDSSTLDHFLKVRLGESSLFIGRRW